MGCCLKSQQWGAVPGVSAVSLETLCGSILKHLFTVMQYLLISNDPAVNILPKSGCLYSKGIELLQMVIQAARPWIK